MTIDGPEGAIEKLTNDRSDKSIGHGQFVGTDVSDERLMLDYRDLGDVRSFDALVRRYEKPIYNYLRRYLRNGSLAEEVVQSTFLRLHEKCDLYDGRRRVRPWLYRIATNQAIDAKRKEGRHRAASLDQGRPGIDADVVTLLNLLKSNAASPLDEAAEHERAEWVHGAVDRLPEVQRVAVLLIFFQGLKYREVAEVIEVPVGTVKARVHHAIVALNKMWRRTHGDGGIRCRGVAPFGKLSTAYPPAARRSEYHADCGQPIGRLVRMNG